MKLYLFYLIKGKDGKILDPPVIYAMTDSKSMSEEFKETRDMDLFYHKIVEGSKDEILMNMDRLKSYTLTRTPFTTKDESGMTNVVDVLCSWKEESDIFLNYTKILYSDVQQLLFNPIIFNKETIDLLGNLKYLEFYQIKYLKNSGRDDLSNYIILTEDIDQLALYLKTFGWMMK